MAGLADFRQQHPEYNDMPDQQLATALHNKYYSDIPVDKYFQKLGLSMKPAVPVPGGNYAPQKSGQPEGSLAVQGFKEPWQQGPLGFSAQDKSKIADFSAKHLPFPGIATQAVQAGGEAADIATRTAESIGYGAEGAIADIAKRFGVSTTQAKKLAGELGMMTQTIPEADIIRAPKGVPHEAPDEAPVKKFNAAEVQQEHDLQVAQLEREGFQAAEAKHRPLATIPPKGPPPPGDPKFEWPDREPKPGVDQHQAFEMGRELDDVLYRVTTNAEADRVEARHYLEDLKPEYRSPEFQEKVYHEIEAQMLPGSNKPPFSDDVKEFLGGDFGRWYAEQQDLYKWLKGHPVGQQLIGADSLPDTSQGYIHRIPKGQGSLYDAGADYSRDTLTGRNLSRKASSLQERKFFVVQDEQGNRHFVPREHAGKVEPGQEIRGSDGKKYTVKPATTAEIEANTPQQYHKNAVVNTVENVLRLRRVQRATMVTEQLRSALKDRGMIYEGADAAKAPRDFIPTRLPQFMGARLPPSIAYSLNDFYGTLPPDMKAIEALDRVNQFLTRTIFFNPVPHLQNVGTFWTIARGSDWVRPQGWTDLIKTGGRAIQDVANQGPITRAMLRQGSALQYPRVANQNFYKLMIERMSGEIDRDPQTWAGLAKNFGFSTPKDLVKQIYRTASKAMWIGNDIFMVQRVQELMDHGMPMDAAIKEAERYIPNYRVPSQLWEGKGGRAASSLLQSPSAIMFGRYKYDQAKFIANLAGDFVKQGIDKKEALARAAVMGGLALAAYPLGSIALRHLTGNQNARLKRSGPLSPIDAIYENITGDKGWLATLSSIVTPAPTTELIGEVASGKDEFGRPIIEPESSTLGKMTQAGEFAAGRIAPLGEAETMLKPGGVAQVAGRNIGIEYPPRSPRPSARATRSMRSEAKRREKNDYLENLLRQLGR